MAVNMRMQRIAPKLDELLAGKIDVSDVKNEDEKQTVFYSRAIAALAIMMRCGIDEDTAARCITDGFHDMGIDAVYNDSVQKKLILVQSKWRKDGAGGISQEEAGTLAQGAKRSIESDFSGCNKKIEAKQSDILLALKDIDYQVELVFCHTGNRKIADYAKRPISDLLRQINEGDVADIVAFLEIGLLDIYNYLADRQSVDNITLDDVVLSNWGTIDEPYKAYYGTVPASALGEWYKTYGNRLFAKNIRYYKGSTDVNQGMKTVLYQEPHKFFYYNNGIKMLCRKITRKAAHSTDRVTGIFVLEGVSLVNGAQTTGTIGNAFLENQASIENAKVLVEMIDLGDADDEAIQITKFTNTQNKFDAKEFAALDPEQERIKTELSFSGIQYLYKSGAAVEDIQCQIALDEAIIAQACNLDDLSIVAMAKRNVGALTENINKAPYKLLFNPATSSFALVNNVHIMRAVDSFLTENESKSTGRERLVLVHGNRFILHLVLSELKNEDNYDVAYLAEQMIQDRVPVICQDYWHRIYEIQENEFADAYPAHIYKNVGRIRRIKEKLTTMQE